MRGVIYDVFDLIGLFGSVYVFMIMTTHTAAVNAALGSPPGAMFFLGVITGSAFLHFLYSLIIRKRFGIEIATLAFIRVAKKVDRQS